ncbi:MAG: type II secretion system F family protein [Nanoarchaeota archaeon]|nr:type II secretion system F family protein [Nanoarchaeota archaeon]
MVSILYSVGDILVPSKYESKLKSYFSKAGHTNAPYKLFGSVFFLSIFLAIGVFFKVISPLLQGSPILMIIILPSLSVLFIFASAMVMWMYYEIKQFRRTVQIEKVLPDFLSEVSVNLRAGMTFDKSLWNAVEPEYTVLAKEIEIVAKKVMTGEDTETALKEFSEKYNSPLLKESIDLIVVGLKSGGEISDLIDRVVENVKQASYLRKELIANVMSYVIFITMISIVIAPTLYALSFNLMVIIQDLGSKITSSAAGGGVAGLTSFGEVVIQREDFISFSKWCIVVIAITSSLIIADLREGNIKGSIKYVFVFIGVALVVYQVMFFVFSGIFGGMVS